MVKKNNIKTIKGTLRSEYKTYKIFNEEQYNPAVKREQTMLYFQWTELGIDRYLIIIPKLFRNDSGDKFAIINGKKFLKLLNDK